ncbi:MAG TPA: Dna2/Cas4 domain-containing protein [Acidiferrobacter sp.]|nr:Dna2/Cas4 domain-containing protein [Acidiferrobacter sp.]
MDVQQPELPMPFPELAGDMPLLPARMVNEYQYCPRLAYLEWVQGEWAKSSDTVEGRHRHRRVDKPGGELPAAGSAKERFHARSIMLSSNRLGLIARMDLLEGEGDRVTPVDYKRGKRPHVEKGGDKSPSLYTPIIYSWQGLRGFFWEYKAVSPACVTATPRGYMASMHLNGECYHLAC